MLSNVEVIYMSDFSDSLKKKYPEFSESLKNEVVLGTFGGPKKGITFLRIPKVEF